MSRDRVLGLDSLRFFLALWVMLGHSALPDTWTHGGIVRAASLNLFVGPAAVIAFFVVSGFCIHYPFRRSDRVDLVPFFVRRHIRIWLPAAASVALGYIVGLRFEGFTKSILWSLVCEEVYYTLYPAMLLARRRFGWTPILAASFVLAYATVITDDKSEGGNYAVHHGYMTWLLGYPCWLMGAWLAEQTDAIVERPAPSLAAIWMWRASAIGVGSIASILRFHSPLTYPWTLDIVAVFVVFWLRAEIRWAWDRKPSAFERLGLASYTIYLTHLVGMMTWQAFGLSTHTFAGWLGQGALQLAIAAVLYFLVERPSHSLAKMCARLVLARTSARAAARTASA